MDRLISFIVGVLIMLAVLFLVPVKDSLVHRWRNACAVDQRIWPELAANDAPHPELTTEQEAVHG